jgi:osmoprotectant transport system substrate-binding protein
VKWLALLLLCGCEPPHGTRIVVGAKNFTEQVLLGELLAQELEAQGEPVDRRFYLAGSYIAHQALVAGRIDAYVEYTGTALASILKQPFDTDRDRVRASVTRLYEERFAVRVTAPLGFQNTFALVMRRADADRLHVTTISALARAPRQRLGAGYEFEERADGLEGLEHTYDLAFSDTPRVMDLGLLYRALANGQVDVVSGNSTDGAVAQLGLTVLTDDRAYFPPYEAVPLVREESLSRHPAIAPALEKLRGSITQEEMQSMNRAVEVEHAEPADVIAAHTQKKGL